jgi:predicted TPR repeat methyltransferase
MIEQYAEGFAQAYDELWNPYPTRAAAQLLKLHESLDPGAERRVLDIGCGTGIVGAAFQQAGYEVTGLDASRAMLERARARLGERASLIHGDAADFRVGEPFPFALSTYDIPNHLGGMDRVRSYLECVFRAVRPGGLFAFDVATRKGLLSINTVQVRETDESILVYRGRWTRRPVSACTGSPARCGRRTAGTTGSRPRSPTRWCRWTSCPPR